MPTFTREVILMMSHLGMEVSSEPEKPAPNPPFVAGMDFKNWAKSGYGF